MDDAITAREQLIIDHIPLLKHIVGRMCFDTPGSMERDDLFGFGMLGLLAAADSWDATRGLAFSTYAYPKIRGAILDELRRQDHVPRSIRKKSRDIGAARESLTRTLGYVPSDKALAEHKPMWAFMAHWETGSGRINDLKGFSDACVKHGVMGIVDAVSSLGVADSVVLEAALSFLGFGVAVPYPSWGTMLQQAYSDSTTHLWPLIPPGAAIAVTFSVSARPYQSLRRGGITGERFCGSIRAGELLLGELLGDADPTGGVTDSLREAITWYQEQIPMRFERGKSVDYVCNNLTAPLGDFAGPARKQFCTSLTSEVAALTMMLPTAFQMTLPYLKSGSSRLPLTGTSRLILPERSRSNASAKPIGRLIAGSPSTFSPR